MNKIGMTLAFVMGTCALVAREKPVIYVDHFIPVVGENCQIKDSGIQTLQDRIVGNVVSSRKYDVVERENISKVQQELKLIDAGMTEGKAPDSNKLKAAGYIIYGKIVQFRSKFFESQIAEGITAKRVNGIVEIQIRIANIETGRQLAAKTVKKTVSKMGNDAVNNNNNIELEAMTEALDAAAKEIVIKLNEIAFPVYITDADGKYVTANISAEQVEIGDVWKIWRRRGKKFDPETNEQDGYREKEMGCAKVKFPGPKETKFELMDREEAKEIEEYIDAMDGKINLDKALILRKVEQVPDVSRKVSAPKKSLRDMY